MEVPSLQLYLSCNFQDLGRKEVLLDYLATKNFAFTAVTVPAPPSDWRKKEKQHYFRVNAKDLMSTSACYLVMADRYHHSSYQCWVDREIGSALFLDKPIIVLQPWSCWSIDRNLRDQADYIVNFPSESIISALTGCSQRDSTKQRLVSYG
ncbi:MAG: hypothetical protein ACRBG0_22600 [Lewinella sp.]|uniref:hypothetical protein n=1 Tax=Lewinella sp. TaxID=2004506 RepID=UPI003D6A72B4